MLRDDSVYLHHIFDAIVRIESYLAGVDEAQFLDTPLLQDGVIRQIEVIGEATKQLSSSFLQRNPRVPWSDIAKMRDKLIHQYFGVDLATVWLTAIEDLPTLKKDVARILASL